MPYSCSTTRVSKILGELDEDLTLSLEKNIGIAFFQRESYGYLGSWRFWNEYGGNFNYENYAEDMGCLFLLRLLLDFTKLGDVANIVSIAQVGYNVGDDNTLCVYGNGRFVDKVLLFLSTDDLVLKRIFLREQQ